MAAWTVLLLDAAFILLSGASTEPRRCYWCGPLAEQVHRSRRSAPCDSDTDTVTVCEPTYDYCAVVATSPHRVESRYCVKVYQDECYPLYCNSTKTWKITCPCRGDLCNGPNTERENRAFALLPGLVAKTHKARIKKRTANAAPNLINNDEKKNIIGNGDAEIHNINSGPTDINIVTGNYVMSNIVSNSSQQFENMQSDQLTNIVIEHHNEESTIVNQAHIQTTTKELIEISIHVSDPTEESSHMKGREQPCTELPTTTVAEEADKITEPVKNEVEPTATTAQIVSNNKATMKTTETNIAVLSEATKTDLVQQDVIIEIKPTDKAHSELPTTTTEMPKNRPVVPEEQMQNDAPATSPTEGAQEMKTTEAVKIVEPPTNENVKSSEMPTAEALQQNGNPPATAPPVPITEKPTEPTTTEATTTPTVITRGQTATITTTPASKRRNKAERITFSYALLLIFIAYL